MKFEFKLTLTLSYPARCISAYCNMHPCPADSTNRSRLNQYGFLGLYLITSSYRIWPMGAHPIGNPGCPEFAFSTASIARNRIVFTDFSTMDVPVFSRVSTEAARTVARGEARFKTGCIRRAVRREDDSRDSPARLLRRNPGRAPAGSARSAEPWWEMARPTRDWEMAGEEDAAMAERNERITGV